MKIVIVGGYGAVGKIISEKLSEVYSNQIVIAGRSIKKAEKLADELGAIPLELDVNNVHDNSFWNEVKMVVMCLDQSDTHFVEFCISKGIHYIDISANYNVIMKIEQLNNQAKTNVVLSVGLAPGITNLLAQHSINQLKDVSSIDIFVLLGLGEKHGDHAFEWTFDNFHTEYTILQNGLLQKVKSFTQPKTEQLEGKRSFYLFDFSDQHVLGKTSTAKRVSTRMAFDLNFMTQMVGFLRKVGLTKIFRNKSLQKMLIPLFKNSGMGSDIYGVKVVVKDNNGKQHSGSFSGFGEGKITAYVAAKTVEYILNNDVTPGVLHLHEIIKDIPLFLKSIDPKAKIELA